MDGKDDRYPIAGLSGDGVFTCKGASSFCKKFGSCRGYMPHSQMHLHIASQTTYLTNPHEPPPILIVSTLPPELLLFQTPKHRKTDGAKRKSQLEAHITPILRVPDPLAYGTDEPRLRHTHHGAEDSKAESEHRGDTGREQARIVPYGDIVFALLEDEVLG